MPMSLPGPCSPETLPDWLLQFQAYVRWLAACVLGKSSAEKSGMERLRTTFALESLRCRHKGNHAEELSGILENC